MGLSIVIQVLDIIFGIAGLLLILRVVLLVFNSSSQNPLSRFLAVITDPFVNVTNRLLGIPSYLRGGFSSIAALVAAIVVLWVGRTMIIWLLQLALYIPGWIQNPLGSVGIFLMFVLRLAFDLYGMALFVRIIFEWVRIPYSSRAMRFLWDITEPLLAPIRRVLPVFGGLDFSPLIAYFLLNLLERVVFMMLDWIF